MKTPLGDGGQRELRRWKLDPAMQLAVSLGADGGVHADEQRPIAGRLGPPHQLLRLGAIAPDIQLEPQWAPLRLSCHRLEWLGGQRGQGVGDPGMVRGPGHRQFTLVVEQTRTADGGEDDWQGDRGAEHGGGGVDAAHVAQHPGHDRHLAEGLPVAAERPLVLAAAVEIAPGAHGKVSSGDRRQVLDVVATRQGPLAVGGAVAPQVHQAEDLGGFHRCTPAGATASRLTAHRCCRT